MHLAVIYSPSLEKKYKFLEDQEIPLFSLNRAFQEPCMIFSTVVRLKEIKILNLE